MIEDDLGGMHVPKMPGSLSRINDIMPTTGPCGPGCWGDAAPLENFRGSAGFYDELQNIIVPIEGKGNDVKHFFRGGGGVLLGSEEIFSFCLSAPHSRNLSQVHSNYPGPRSLPAGAAMLSPVFINQYSVPLHEDS